MNRRKVIIGTGVAASGLAMAVGAGAFSSVSVERSVTVNVEGDDADAYLLLEPKDDDIAEIENGKLELAFDELEDDENNVRGSGVNEQSTTEFTDVFSITNQGRDEARLVVDEATAEESDTDPDWELIFYAVNGNDDERTELNADVSGEELGEAGITLTPGESTDVDVVIENNEIEADDDGDDGQFDTEIDIIAATDDSRTYDADGLNGD